MKDKSLIKIDSDDLYHIAHLLRDDMQFCYECIEAAPYSDAAEEALESLKRSRALLTKLTDHVLQHSYEPTSMATRPHLN